MFNSHNLILASIAIPMLTACGSSNDRPVDSNTSPSLASSSVVSASSSSASPVLSCNTLPGAVFIDDVCTDWSEPKVFQQLKADYNMFEEIPLGEEGLLATVRMIDSGDPAHNTVLDIQYNDNSEYNAMPRIYAANNADMSRFAGGELVFDLKVLDLGSSSGGLDLVIECGYPCKHTDYRVNIDTLNQWNTYRIPVNDLIIDGLDIFNVAMGFQLIPMWNVQNNAHYQVDNIYWQEGSDTPVDKCFSEHYDRTDGGGYHINLAYPQSDNVVEYEPWQLRVGSVISLVPQWETAEYEWAFVVYEPESAMGILESCAYSGTLSASINLPEAYTSDPSLQVAFAFAEQSGNIVYSPPIYTSTLPTDEWTKISTQLSSNAAYTNVSGIGLAFFGSNTLPNSTAQISWDNIVITH